MDRTTLPQNETFQLELSGTFSAFNLSIDLSPLEKDFRVLDNRRSTNMQYINGDFSAKTTLTITLEPKKSGILTIPPITIEGESSKPISLKITKADNGNSDSQNQAPPLDIEVILEHPTTWVQTQQVLKIRLYQSVQLFNLELQGVKELQQLGFDIEQIGENKTYQSKRHNITYQVTELNYLLSSDNAGSYELPEFIFEGQMPTRASRYGKRLEARTAPITMNVLDVPSHYPSANWIPATDLQISDDLASVTEINTGESLNRNLVISVHGQEAAVIPDLPAIDTSDRISIYSDAPELNDQMTPEGITGVRMDSIALIAKASGTVVLPEIRIPWFNTKTAKTEVAVLPQRTIKIKGGASVSSIPSDITTNQIPNQTQRPSEKMNEAAPATDQTTKESTSSTTNQIQETSEPSLWTKILIISLFITVLAQSVTILRLLKKLKANEQLPPVADKPNTETSLDSPLPNDFSSCYRFIQKELTKHQLSTDNLPSSVIALLDRFRESTYSATQNHEQFSAKDKEELRSLLKEFFAAQTKASNTPTLYPQ